MSHTMMTRSQTRIAELEARIAELEKENKELKEETKEYQAVEQFIIETDIDSALRAHYREGKVIDGEWVNN
jgi:cell division protein FtsL